MIYQLVHLLRETFQKSMFFFLLDAIKGNSHQYFGDYATTGDILDEDVMIFVDIILDSENDYSKLFFK